MSLHAPIPSISGGPLRPQDVGGFLLDQCRRLAGSRWTGAITPADAVLESLKAALPEPEACRVFGRLYGLIGTIARDCGDDFLWYPAGSKRRSADEARLIEGALALIAGGEAPAVEEAAPRIRAVAGAVALEESYCAAADALCGLFTATGTACPGSCPVEGLGRSAGERPKGG